jgi:hypothetical protein
MSFDHCACEPTLPLKTLLLAYRIIQLMFHYKPQQTPVNWALNTLSFPHVQGSRDTYTSRIPPTGASLRSRPSSAVPYTCRVQVLQKGSVKKNLKILRPFPIFAVPVHVGPMQLQYALFQNYSTSPPPDYPATCSSWMLQPPLQ